MLTVSAYFSDGAVVQAGAPASLAGTCAPNRPVSIRWNGQTEKTTSDETGRWAAQLGPVSTYGAAQLEIESDGGTLQRQLMVGDVWLASGQSNMMWHLEETMGGPEEVATANDPLLRFFRVEERASLSPCRDVQGSWTTLQPHVAARFSAVGYHFGRALRRTCDRPIAIIETAIGGTLLSCWREEGTLRNDPQTWEYWKAHALACSTYAERVAAWEKDGTGVKPPPPERTLPAGYFNGMIAPLHGFPLRGVIWYQGESNNRNADHYEREFTCLIAEWRKHWRQPELPFLFVQLAGFDGQPGVGHNWPYVREAQMKVWRKVSHTGMATAIDVGEAHNIHPRDKAPVGQRLALQARHLVYGEKLTPSGPVFRRAQAEGDGLRLSFDFAEQGLISCCGKDHVPAFEMAGADLIYHPARALIQGGEILVQSSEVREPVHVRYAWSGCPDVTLQNREGLPALPFRTDEIPFVAQ